jgi:hypothetical protein
MFDRIRKSVASVFGVQARDATRGTEPGRSGLRLTLSRAPTCGTGNPPLFLLEVAGEEEGAQWQASCRSSIPYPHAPQVCFNSQGRLSPEECAAFFNSLESAGVWQAKSSNVSRAGGEVVTLKLHDRKRSHTVQWFELPGRMEERADADRYRGPRDPSTERIRGVVNAGLINSIWETMRRGYKNNLWEVDAQGRRVSPPSE